MGIVDRLRTARYLRVLRASGSASAEELAEAKTALGEMGAGSLEALFECLTHPAARVPAMDVLERLLTTDTLPDFVEALGAADRRTSTAVQEILEKGHRYDPRALLPYLSERDVARSRLEPDRSEDGRQHDEQTGLHAA